MRFSRTHTPINTYKHTSHTQIPYDTAKPNSRGLVLSELIDAGAAGSPPERVEVEVMIVGGGGQLIASQASFFLIQGG